MWGVCSWGCTCLIPQASRLGDSLSLLRFAAGATQVKWNRREPHVVASAHDNKVLIWDDRVSYDGRRRVHGDG